MLPATNVVSTSPFPPLARGLIATTLVVACARGTTASHHTPAVTITPPASTADNVEGEQDDACGSLGGSFNSAWPHIKTRLESGLDGLATLLDAEYGFFVLDNAGAFVVPTYFQSLEEALPQVVSLRAEYYAFNCPREELGKTPVFSCEDESWSSEGCLITSNPDFSIVSWYEAAAKVMDSEAPAQNVDQARATDAAIAHGVYSTQDTLGFYFARVGCQWRVVAIDAVSPCDA